MLESTALVLTLFGQLVSGQTFVTEAPASKGESAAHTSTTYTAALGERHGLTFDVIYNVQDGAASRVEVERCEISTLYYGPESATGFCQLVSSNRYGSTAMASKLTLRVVEGNLVLETETLTPHLCFDDTAALKSCHKKVTTTFAKSEGGQIMRDVITERTWVGARRPGDSRGEGTQACDLMSGVGCGFHAPAGCDLMTGVGCGT